MKSLIIFGVNNLAELAHYYFTNDSQYSVAAFSAHRAYRKIDSFKNLPVIEFEEIVNKLPPKDYCFFIPMIASKMNKDRERVYLEAKEKGYEVVSYISSKATVLTDDIGENCFILEDNTIQPFTQIGNNVILWSGNHIGHHSRIKDHIFISSHVVISGNCEINNYCFLGVNSCLKEKVVLAEGTYVSMNTSITSNTEEYSVYKGFTSEKVNNMSSLRIRF